MFDFTFSIVMAIYNSDEYLEEAIDSVILQDIGFEDHVQLILVDDGSTDSSLNIIKMFKELYPDNIVVLHKENEGPASARNMGLQYVRGKYVNFLDSDDKLSFNTLSNVYNFFLDYNTNLVSIPIQYFGRKTGNQYMNYRFENEGVIDLNHIIDFPEFSASSCFIRYESLKDFRFNEQLVNGEDLLFINQILLKDMNYGLMNSAYYHYRKRYDYSSLMDNIFSSESFYTEKLKHCYKQLIDFSRKAKGNVPKFIQYVIVQDLHGIIKSENFVRFINTREKISEFYYYLDYIMSYIDMDVILAQRNLPEHSKSFLIYIKNTMKYDIDVTHDNIVLRTGRHLINNVRTAKIKISDISIVRNKIHIAGYILTCCDNDYFHFTVNDSSIRNFEIDEVDIDFLGIPWLFYKRFAFEIPFVNELEFKLVYSENGKHSILKNNIYYYENRRTSSRIIRNGQIILFENNKIILLNNSIKDKLKTYYEKLVKYLKSKGV